ncbi:hypothetical protein AB0M28_02135 [Streptomyces sp. NPDC051940]|uniref:Acg family FMN-binding oxidoreductase n=1 Tax=Streptomyces sp. NPDC051940 TaxID=3155675 RepID=UPI003442BFE9
MPPTTLDAQLLERVITAAVAAPSIFNTQPWRFRLNTDNGALEIRAVPGRGLVHLDPTGRALHVSVGAGVFNLRVAAAHFGNEPVVRLLPDPAEPALLAAVRFTRPVRPGRGHRPDLYDSVWHRRSSRFPFAPVRPPGHILAELRDAAHAEGAALHFPEEEQAGKLLRLTAEAEQRNRNSAARRMESRRWLRENADDGIPAAALGLQDATDRVPARDHSATRNVAVLQAAAYEPHPLIAVLTTAHDTRADWLRTGQALEHVLLDATRHSLRASLYHQAVEWPDLRAALYDTRRGRGHVQMLIRIGYGPEGPPTSRRPVSEVLDDPE